MPHEIAVPTTCTLCSKKFYGPKTVLKFGETPPQRFFEYMERLLSHVGREHPEAAIQVKTLAAEFEGWKFLSLFTSADPEVLDQQNFFRWKVHQETLRCRAKDLHIKAREVAKQIAFVNGGTVQQVLNLERNPEISVVIQSALEELRDLLEEPGLYSPKPASEEPKITVPDTN